MSDFPTMDVPDVGQRHLLDPGMNLTLRPMQYPQFYEMYRDAIKNTWTVEEVDFSMDTGDLKNKMGPAERHLIQRLVAFFATGDSIVANNLVLNLYKHINAPEARLYLSRQLYEEALHVQFYLTLLDTYIPDVKERAAAFAAIDNIPSIRKKAEFCFKWIDSIQDVDKLETKDQRRQFLLNLICFAACIEGLFFFGAFAYVYFLRSKGLLHGLAGGTNWVFRDESCVVSGTEILTPSGWVKFEDLQEGQLVAQFDMGTKEVSFVEPLRVIHKPVSEDVVILAHKKGGLHQMVTKDHDLVQKWNYQQEFSKVTADDFKPNGKKQFAAAGYKRSGRSDLTVHERFLIALQADGTLPTDRYTGERCGTLPVTFNLTKARKQSRLKSICKEAGYQWTVSDTGKEFRVSVPVELPLTKTFSDWVRLEEVSSDWCSDFIEELGLWDGHTPKDPANGFYVYYSSIVQENVAVVQAVASLCGRSSSQSSQVKTMDGKDFKIYRVWVHESDTFSGGSLTKKYEPYTGDVHCVTVPTGAILIRSNGKVSVTGNCHMNFAFEVVDTVRKEDPTLFDDKMNSQIREMIAEAIECEAQFAEDLLGGGISGMSLKDMQTYLEYVADQRLTRLGLSKVYNQKNPFAFLDLQDVQEVTNFFERRVSAYQVGITGDVDLESDF